jgi:hypothetical protein
MIGGFAVVIGPLVVLTGQLLLQRAIKTAASNPITAWIVSQPGQSSS